MPSIAEVLHVTDASAEGLFSIAALNHIAIERANGLNSQILVIPNHPAMGWSWRHKRLKNRFPEAFVTAKPASADLAFVYGCAVVTSFAECVASEGPAKFVVVLVNCTGHVAEALRMLRRLGWPGEVAILSDPLVIAKPEGIAARHWPIALDPVRPPRFGPVRPCVGISCLGRTATTADVTFVGMLVRQCRLPVMLMSEEGDLSHFEKLGPSLSVLRRGKENWTKFLASATLLVMNNPPPDGAGLESTMGRMIQRGLPVLCVGEGRQIPGTMNLPDVSSLIKLLGKLGDHGRHQAFVRQNNVSVSSTIGPRGHIEKIRKILIPPIQEYDALVKRSPDGPDAPAGSIDLIAAWLISATPSAVARWLSSGVDIEAFQSVLAHLVENGQGLTIAKIQNHIQKLCDGERSIIPSSLQFWLGLFAAEWYLEESLAQSALIALQSLEVTSAVLQVDQKTYWRVKRKLALALSQTGRQNQAEAVLTALIANGDPGWWPRFQLARWLKHERPAEALELLDTAIKVGPRKLPAILIAERSDVLIRLGRHDESLSYLESELSGRDEQRSLLLALANAQLGCGQTESWSHTLLRLLLPEDRFGVLINIKRSLALLDRFQSLQSAPSPAELSAPLIAVVMSAYNAERTIAAAISSVLAQSYSNFRLVIVDDCSSDGTLDVINRMARRDGRVIVIQNARNEGPYSARNLAMSLVAADFYTFHDSDDWMHPNRLARHLSFMQKHRQIVCSYSCWVRLDPLGYVASGERENPASSFFSREIFHAVGTFDMVRVGADREFRDRLRRRYGKDRVVVMDDTLAFGLKSAGSLTTAPKLGFDRYNFSAVRLRYKEAYWKWFLELSSVDELRLDRHGSRKFPAPPEMAVPSEDGPHPFANRSLEHAPSHDSIVVQWPCTEPVVRNWGDKLNPDLVGRMSRRSVVNSLDPKRIQEAPVHLVIGSSLGYSSARTVVWGSGFISAQQTLREAPKRICAVRGPLSRERLLSLGIACPEVFGDPALLYPLFYLPKAEPRFDVGLIQHCREAGEVSVPTFSSGISVRLIDICGGLRDVIDAILSCRCIISSSLHGVIAAHAYGVRAAWIRLSDRPKGDGFKFRDYWASVGRTNTEPLSIEGIERFVADGNDETFEDISVNLYALLRACPFIDPDRQEELIARAKAARFRTPQSSVLNRHVGVALEG